MRELSLFTGAGGGLLGTHLLGWRPIGYVEFNDYCQRVIRQRIEDGILPRAPIFGDVRQFIQSGAAAQYRGFADVVTGGFPCQPFSVAGKRAGADDERNMWPATIECIRLVRPKYALLENVPGLLSSGYFGTILGDLAQSGYDCRWRILSAAEVGAPHKRDRLWIVADASSTGAGLDNWRASGNSRQGWQPANSSQLAILRQEHRAHRSEGIDTGSADVADTPGKGLEKRERLTGNDGEKLSPIERGGNMANAERVSCRAQEVSGQTDGTHATRPASGLSRPSWWATEPDVGRVADGIPARVDRLKALGNGQVPAVVRAAWHLLTQEA